VLPDTLNEDGCDTLGEQQYASTTNDRYDQSVGPWRRTGGGGRQCAKGPVPENVADEHKGAGERELVAVRNGRKRGGLDTTPARAG
jgi:hypothetical protein